MGAEGNRALLNFGVRIHEISKCKCTYAHVKIMCVNEIEGCMRPSVNVKVERGSTLTCTRDSPYIVSVLFTSLKGTCA